MGIISRIMDRRMTVDELDRLIIQGMDGGQSAVGKWVDPAAALRVSAFFDGVRILAETIGSLPLHVYERQEPRGRRRATGHPLYELLHTAPNPEMSAKTFRSTLQGHLPSWGNAYAEIIWNDAGQVRELWPLRPDRTEPVRANDGSLWYKVEVQARTFLLPAYRVLHVSGFGFDGMRGYSVVRLARESLGLALATEEHGARLFGNGAVPKTVLTYPGTLTEKAEDNLRLSWEEKHQGLSKAHRLAILQEGMKIEQIGLNNEDSQFLATREFQVTEIARWLNLPPHMLKDLTRSTYSNIEHQGLEFVQYSLTPWLVSWEQAIALRCMTSAERRRYYAEHLVDGLLRGDIGSRYNAYAVARQWGWFSANDVRELENQNPIEGGDAYLVPLNMVPADQAGTRAARSMAMSLAGRELSGAAPEYQNPAASQDDQEERAARSAKARRRLSEAFRNVFRDAAGRIVRREVNDVGALAKKHLGQRGAADFDDALREFYRGHAEFVERHMLPTLQSYADAVQAEANDEIKMPAGMTPALEEFVRAYLLVFVERYNGSSLGQLQAVLREELDAGRDPLPAIQERLVEWEEKRPEKIARRETTQAGNAITRAVYIAGGITTLRWNAFGENCPYCQALDGKKVGINSHFVRGGEELNPEGAEAPMKVYSDTGHPPLHDGCLPGYARISAQGITAASKRWFDGNLIVIRTASGHELACTPNHPILTPSGWVAASVLNVGGHVVSHRGPEWEFATDQNREDMPARIEHVAETFGRRPEMVAMPVPVSPKDFHGDGMGSKVAVVWTDRLLVDRGYAPLGKQRGQLAFVGGNVQSPRLAGLSGETLLGEGLGAAGGCPVCGGGLSLALSGGHLTGPDLPGSAATSRGNAVIQEYAMDSQPADAKVSRESELGRASSVPRNNLALIDRIAASPSGLRGLAPWTNDAGIPQPDPNRFAADAQLASELLAGSAGPIFADQIVRVERLPFHGFVYNLQTEKGFYVSESIITHNCDCVISPG